MFYVSHCFLYVYKWKRRYVKIPITAEWHRFKTLFYSGYATFRHVTDFNDALLNILEYKGLNAFF